MAQPTSPLFQLVDKPVQIDPPNMVIGFGDDYDRIFKKGVYAVPDIGECPDCETPFEEETYPYCKHCRTRWD